MSFSATPSDKRRGSKNAVTQLKRLMRDLGWKAQPEKENPMRMAKQGMSKFDGQSVSLGAASDCKVTRIKPPMVAGVEIPLPYAAYANGETVRAQTPDDKAVTVRRNEAMLEAKQAGAHNDEIWKALKSAGWHSVKKDSVSSLLAQEKRRQGLPVRPVNAKKRKPELVAAKPPVQAAPAIGGDSLIIEIAQAIAPILARRMGDNRTLKAKADKWDAIRDLIGGGAPND
jgi:hypothetical protein